jgi:Protein of unknown function (DUF1176)
MSLRYPLLLLLAATSFSQAASAQIRLGEQKFFKDWGVACDNALSCEAVAFQRETNFDNAEMTLKVARNARDGALTVTLVGEASKTDSYRLIIDGRTVDSGRMATAGDGTVNISGTVALKVARALARGNMLRLEDGQGTLLGRTSLRGSSAALLHVDVLQNRAGTRDALVAVGRKSLRPKWLPVPVIEAKRIGSIGPVPDATAIVGLVEISGCAAERNGVTEDSAHSLGNRDGMAKALVLVSCGSGAYNLGSVGYIGTQATNGRWSFEPARYDFAPLSPDENGKVYLINAGWTEEAQQLSSYSKARGIGDCGSNENYVWDGAIFRLVEAYGMDQCRGSLDWMRLWRADLKLVD